MKIGDRVRLLRGTEEGRIVQLKKGNIIEIEIEDGFIIPVLKNEIALIDKQEAKTFKEMEFTQETNVPTKHPENIPDGLYLGLRKVDETSYQSYLINQTGQTILYVLSQYDKKIIKGISFGICEQYNIVETGSLTSSFFNESKRLHLQVIFYQDRAKLKKQPINKELNIRTEHLEEKSYISSISDKVSLINIEKEDPFIIDKDELRNQMLGENRRTEESKEEKKHHIQHTVDLHIDSSITELKPNEMLEYQLNEFEKAYDNALVMNLSELKIIHGVGAGILRKEIHKRLAKKTDVKYFEDADKERFGFGSTIIYF